MSDAWSEVERDDDVAVDDLWQDVESQPPNGWLTDAGRGVVRGVALATVAVVMVSAMAVMTLVWAAVMLVLLLEQTR